jgi:hypothetical protein
MRTLACWEVVNNILGTVYSERWMYAVLDLPSNFAVTHMAMGFATAHMTSILLSLALQLRLQGSDDCPRLVGFPMHTDPA